MYMISIHFPESAHPICWTLYKYFSYKIQTKIRPFPDMTLESSFNSSMHLDNCLTLFSWHLDDSHTFSRVSPWETFRRYFSEKIQTINRAFSKIFWRFKCNCCWTTFLQNSYKIQIISAGQIRFESDNFQIILRRLWTVVINTANCMSGW